MPQPIRRRPLVWLVAVGVGVGLVVKIAVG
jgi:hypothetical protein